MNANAMIGRSTAFRAILRLIDMSASYDAPVLIEGETGTGKELVARSIHYGGPRRDRPFVPVNCGALPDQLIENELFGHRRGAFTDAREDHAGLVVLAHRGSLFLDEVDALSPRAQVTLLRFLQDLQYRPLGGRREEKADVRIMAASNRCLEPLVAAGLFRMDLLYRLKLLHIVLPPLRDREGDAALLARHFMDLAAARFGKPARPIAEATLDWFERYPWPGNIRELENLLYREILLCEQPQLSIAAPASLGGPAAPDTPTLRLAKKRALEQFESQFLARVFDQAHGNVTEAARLCGTERRHFGRLLRKYQIVKTTSQA